MLDRMSKIQKSQNEEIIKIYLYKKFRTFYDDQNIIKKIFFQIIFCEHFIKESLMPILKIGLILTE